VVFRRCVTNVTAGIFSWDMNTNEVVREQGTYELYGLPEDGPATMETLLSRVPEEDQADVIAAMRQMMSSCGTYEIKYRVLAQRLVVSMTKPVIRAGRPSGPGRTRPRASIGRSEPSRASTRYLIS
jgi:hypothetical protein